MAAHSGKVKKRGIFRKIIIAFNILAALALLCSYFAPWIHPDKVWFLAFAGLAYPILAAVNVLFVAMWLIFKWKYSVLSIVVVLAGFNHLRSHFQISGKTRELDKTECISVMNYNVRNFDIYNYGKHWEYNYSNRNKIFSFLKVESPDIICFQEFVNDLTGDFSTRDTLVKLLPDTNVHVEYTVVSRDIIQFGIATFTIYPIINTGKIIFDNSNTNLCIWTDLLIGTDTVRVYNAHFESIHLSSDDREFANDISDLKQDSSKTTLYKGTKSIVSRLRQAFFSRANQTEVVANHMALCPYPLILCTDLNDTPCSYAYRQLKKSLSDAFTKAGEGFGKTYRGLNPSFRIDYIFYSDQFKAYNYQCPDIDYSDHYPVQCDLVIQH